MADRDLSRYRIMASYVLNIYIYIYIYYTHEYINVYLRYSFAETEPGIYVRDAMCTISLKTVIVNQK